MTTVFRPSRVFWGSWQRVYSRDQQSPQPTSLQLSTTRKSWFSLCLNSFPILAVGIPWASSLSNHDIGLLQCKRSAYFLATGLTFLLQTQNIGPSELIHISFHPPMQPPSWWWPEESIYATYRERFLIILVCHIDVATVQVPSLWLLHPTQIGVFITNHDFALSDRPCMRSGAQL